MRSLIKSYFVLVFVVFLILVGCSLEFDVYAGKNDGQYTGKSHGLGLKLSRPDPSRKIDKERLGGYASIPLAASVDLTDDLPPIGDQGEHPSCVGFATGYYCKTWWEKQEHPTWDLTNSMYYFSPAYVYNQINGGEDNGSSIYDALGLMQNYGCVDFKEFPYDGDYKKQPTSSQIEAGKQYRIDSDWGYFFAEQDWGPYNRQNVIDDLKAWLNAKKPLVLGIPIYDDFPDYGNPPSSYYDSIYGLSNPPINSPPTAGGNLYGGHAVYIAGYDDNAGGVGKGGFLMVNSWGSSWNGNGRVYLSYDFVQELVPEAWFFDDVDSSPTISSLSPTSLGVGATLTIKGTNFGTKRRSAKVSFTGGVNGTVKSWTNSEIKVTVPGGAQTGNVYVYDWNGEKSNGKSVTIGEQIISSWGWMLAEGATWSGFDEWVLVQNPNLKNASVKFTFLTPSGKVDGPTVTVAAQSRFTIHVNEFVSQQDVSTIVTPLNGVSVCAERAMYVDAPDGKWGAHDCVAAPEPAPTWYLAEGATWPGYDEWILIMNPYNDAVNVSVYFQTPSGEVPGPSMSLSGCTRRSIHVNDFVPNADVSAKVVCTTQDRGVVVERAMYINTPDGKRGCHDSIGVTSPEPAWAMTEGCTYPGFETWVLIQNPNKKTVSGYINFVTPYGLEEGPGFQVGPGGRLSVRVNDWVWDEDVSTVVSTNSESDTLVCERAMYINDGTRRGAHNAPGSAYVSNKWILPEGCTSPGFDEWVLVANYTDDIARTRLTFMTSSGPVQGPTVDIEPLTRLSFHVNVYVTGDVSTTVESDNYVVAERAMYIDSFGRGGATDSLGVYFWDLGGPKGLGATKASPATKKLASIFKFRR